MVEISNSRKALDSPSFQLYLVPGLPGTQCEVIIVMASIDCSQIASSQGEIWGILVSGKKCHDHGIHHSGLDRDGLLCGACSYYIYSAPGCDMLSLVVIMISILVKPYDSFTYILKV